MRFDQQKVAPHDIYGFKMWEEYHSPGRELHPYADLTMSAIASGFYEPIFPHESEERSPRRTRSALDTSVMPAKREEYPDPVEEIFHSRRAFLEHSVADLLREIEERRGIEKEHSSQIDEESCEAKTRIFSVDHWHPAMNKEADRIRANAEKDIFGLERERRMEEIACWRDVSRLQSELRGVLEEWSGEQRKETLLFGGKQF